MDALERYGGCRNVVLGKNGENEMDENEDKQNGVRL